MKKTKQLLQLAFIIFLFLSWITPQYQSERFNTVLADVLKEGAYEVVHINLGLHGGQPGRIQPGTFDPLTRAFLEEHVL